MSKRSRTVGKILIIVGAGALIWTFFASDLNTYFSLAALKARIEDFNQFYSRHRWLTMMIYLAIYIIVAALSLPGAVAFVSRP